MKLAHKIMNEVFDIKESPDHRRNELSLSHETFTLQGL